MHNGKRPGDILMINVNNYIIINFFNRMVHCIHKKKCTINHLLFQNEKNKTKKQMTQLNKLK